MTLLQTLAYRLKDSASDNPTLVILEDCWEYEVSQGFWLGDWKKGRGVCYQGSSKADWYVHV